MNITNNILLIRPENFGYNAETAVNNSFQNQLNDSTEVILEKAKKEFDNFTKELKKAGINVFVIEDTKEPIKPDAIFPNNWITFHPNGAVILYPMFAPNRRLERRKDIISTLKNIFEISTVIDLSSYETENKFLEGTGSIVFDHPNKIAYACLSPRTDKEIFIEVCQYLKYKPIYFYALDENDQEIYHTNVMMCISKNFAVICTESIKDEKERKMVLKSLQDSGHKIIDISLEQVKNFAGNMLALKTKRDKTLLVLSKCAYDNLTSEQKDEISNFCTLFPLSIETIETIGGGSVRCMIAELFLYPQLEN